MNDKLKGKSLWRIRAPDANEVQVEMEGGMLIGARTSLLQEAAEGEKAGRVEAGT